MQNVLFVKTHKTGGRAWAAWAIKEESAAELEYVVSVNGKETTVYAVNDYVMGTFKGQDYLRAFFDLTSINGTALAEKIVTTNGELFGSGWVIKYGTV